MAAPPLDVERVGVGEQLGALIGERRALLFEVAPRRDFGHDDRAPADAHDARAAVSAIWASSAAIWASRRRLLAQAGRLLGEALGDGAPTLLHVGVRVDPRGDLRERLGLARNRNRDGVGVRYRLDAVRLDLLGIVAERSRELRHDVGRRGVQHLDVDFARGVDTLVVAPTKRRPSFGL